MLAESGNSSYKNATVMFQLLVEEYMTLVNCVQNWQGSTIKQQRLWVLLPAAVKDPSTPCLKKTVQTYFLS